MSTAALAAGRAEAARTDARAAGDRWPDRAVEALAVAVLVFAPLAFGTVQPWSEAVVTLLVLTMALVWVGGMVHDWELRVALPPGWQPAALFLALVGFQLVPLPAALADWLDPVAGRAHAAAAAALGDSPWLRPLSADPAATAREGTKVLVAALFFLVVYNSCTTRRRAERLVWTMVLVASAVALFGIVQRVAWTGRLYWVGPLAPHANAFGPFVNRAHFAGLVAVVVPMALWLWMSALYEARRRDRDRDRLRTLGDRMDQWLEAGGARGVLLPFFILLMGGAALVAGSRGGLLAVLAALVGMAAFAPTARGRRHRLARHAAAVAALVVLAGLWIGGDALTSTLERLAEEIGRPEEGARLAIWRDALALFAQAPLLGTGYGTFGAVFPTVRTIQAPVAYTHAESDVVQLLTDTGVVGGGLVVAAALLVAMELVRGVRTREQMVSRLLALAGLMALVGALVQGVGNYNWPVTSNLLLVAAAVGAAAKRYV